jgi:hypothetical protein
VLDKVVSNLPEIVRAMAEPLSKVDRISIVSTGGGHDGNLGANRITGDLVSMLAQVPAVLQAVTGLRMDELLARVPGLQTVDATPSPNGTPSASGASASQPAAENGGSEASAATTPNPGGDPATSNGSASHDVSSDFSDTASLASRLPADEGSGAGAGVTNGGTSRGANSRGPTPRRRPSR